MSIYKRSEENDMSIYERHGYKDREDYLDSLAENYGVSRDLVDAYVSILGESEMFDGLVIALEDLENDL